MLISTHLMPPIGYHWPSKHILIIYYVQKVALQNFFKEMHETLLRNLKNFLFTVIFKIITKNNIRSLTLISSTISDHSNNNFLFIVTFIFYAIPQKLFVKILPFSSICDNLEKLSWLSAKLNMIPNPVWIDLWSIMMKNIYSFPVLCHQHVCECVQ